MPTPVYPSDKLPNPLAFGLYPTNGYAKCVWSDGEWGELQWVVEPYINLHVGSVGMNYGQSIFEGLKAFRGPDGQVRIFRPKDNAARMNHSAEVVMMPEISEEKFLAGVHMVVGRNLELVPHHAPYGATGSMYVRPLMFGSGPNLILSPPSEFTLLFYVTPTGSLYGTTGSAVAPAVDALVLQDFDRSAPLGVGHAKLAGNYAPTFKHAAAAKKAGYAITLHLDSATRSYIDEFSTSNFLGIVAQKDPSATPKLVVPFSPSILKSVTTKAIIDICKSFGWEVEMRAIPFSEVISGQFEEVCACGTAAAITPIRSITYNTPEGEKTRIAIGGGEVAGPRFLAVLAELTGIQSGVRADKFGWTWPKEGVDGSV